MVVNPWLMWLNGHLIGNDPATIAPAVFWGFVWGPLNGGFLGWLSSTASAREVAARGEGFRPFRLSAVSDPSHPDCDDRSLRHGLD